MGNEKIETFVLNQIKRQPDISATKLSRKVINQAMMNDNFSVKDDATSGVIYFREPREFMLIAGPPFYKIKDFDFAGRIKDFTGKKIICGGTTAEIIARELNLDVELQHGNKYHDKLPPSASMSGFEKLTEGILTLGKVEEILETYDSETCLGDSPHEEVVELLLQNDSIDIIVDTRINWAYQDPDQPLELELRKFVVKRIAKILMHKFFKKVKLEYV
jgi:hypothetical protein